MQTLPLANIFFKVDMDRIGNVLIVFYFSFCEKTMDFIHDVRSEVPQTYNTTETSTIIFVKGKISFGTICLFGRPPNYKLYECVRFIKIIGIHFICSQMLKC